MRKVMLSILMITLTAAIGCRREDPTRGATPTPTLTTTAKPAAVIMKLIGLCTIADSGVASETAKQTAILAKHSGHEASFIVQEHHLASTAGFTQLTDPKGKLTEYWAYPLTGVQIELDQDKDNWDGGTAVVFSTAGDGSNATFPTLKGTGQNDSSIHWIPSMTSILGSAPSILRRYVQPEPSPNDVLARIPMRGGTLVSVLDHPYYLWQFRTTGNVYKQVQVVADQIHYSFNLKKDKKEFKVYGRNFGSTGAAAPLFTVKTNGADEEIEIFVANLPPGGFFAEDKRARGYKDPHFHLHYNKLVSGTTVYEPVIIGRAAEGEAGPLGSSVYCGSERLP